VFFRWSKTTVVLSPDGYVEFYFGEYGAVDYDVQVSATRDYQITPAQYVTCYLESYYSDVNGKYARNYMLGIHPSISCLDVQLMSVSAAGDDAHFLNIPTQVAEFKIIAVPAIYRQFNTANVTVTFSAKWYVPPPDITGTVLFIFVMATAAIIFNFVLLRKTTKDIHPEQNGID
jgi:hypothetical protein